MNSRKTHLYNIINFCTCCDVQLLYKNLTYSVCGMYFTFWVLGGMTLSEMYQMAHLHYSSIVFSPCLSVSKHETTVTDRTVADSYSKIYDGCKTWLLYSLWQTNLKPYLDCCSAIALLHSGETQVHQQDKQHCLDRWRPNIRDHTCYYVEQQHQRHCLIVIVMLYGS